MFLKDVNRTLEDVNTSLNAVVVFKSNDDIEDLKMFLGTFS